MSKEEKENWNKFNQSKWMMYEDDIIKYYYKMLIEWLNNGMIKPANIQFTSGLGRDIARLMEDSRLLGTRSANNKEICFLTELKNHYNNTSETRRKIEERLEELKC